MEAHTGDVKDPADRDDRPGPPSEGGGGYEPPAVRVLGSVAELTHGIGPMHDGIGGAGSVGL